MNSPEEFEKKLKERKRKLGIVKALLNTPDGQVLMELLEGEYFNCRLDKRDLDKAAFDLGARHVVWELREIRDREEN